MNDRAVELQNFYFYWICIYLISNSNSRSVADDCISLLFSKCWGSFPLSLKLNFWFEFLEKIIKFVFFLIIFYHFEFISTKSKIRLRLSETKFKIIWVSEFIWLTSWIFLHWSTISQIVLQSTLSQIKFDLPI